MTFLDLKIHIAMLKIAVDATSCVERLTEYQRKFAGSIFFILVNITVILQVFLYFGNVLYLINIYPVLCF